jgi:hypothetical protein
MPIESMPTVVAPAPPCARLCIGITGHRETNPEFMAQREQVQAALTQVLDAIDAAVAAAHADCTRGEIGATRLCSLLADGADQMVASGALARGWELVAPLPFGRQLNIAINAHPQSPEDAQALLTADGLAQVAAADVRERAARLHALSQQARLFELADRDEFISRIYLDKLRSPDDRHLASVFAAESSLRVALAGRVLIEQSDILLAVWDGASYAQVGGTGHTVRAALESGAPVVWIDARAPQGWRILAGPEALADLDAGAEPAADAVNELHALVRGVLASAGTAQSAPRQTLTAERWPVRSRPLWHAYRRIEALFGAADWRARLRNLTQTYETPDEIATGSGAALLAAGRALPGLDARFADAIGTEVLRRFAWADGVSAWRSDVYRGGMTANFLLAALAIVGGIAYLPFADPHHKWGFALFELFTLVFILAVTTIGQKRRWHGRWFETRRVAEYLRHAPLMLLLGVARAPGRWPRGTDTSWPEWCARHAVREVGLPRVAVTEDYLRMALRDLLLDHVVRQQEYHVGKARRLAAAHHNLDHLSARLFQLAIISVAGYLLLKVGGVLHLWPKALAEGSSMQFTFLGVLLPTFGGALAGIRYFGDFERFATISRITAEKLQNIRARIEHLLRAPPGQLDYGQVADLAHAADDVVVSEIESWQAVFGGKQVTVPV